MGKQILVAVDSFKGSMSSNEIGEVFKRISKNIKSIPIADGGEGSLAAFRMISKDEFEVIHFQGKDTYLRPQQQWYLLKGQSAYIESALICGISPLMDVLNSSSEGVGIALKDAYAHGARTIYLFLGGTGTNDGGMGTLTGLGYQFFDKHDKPLESITANLGKISYIIEPKTPLNFDQIYLISDVTNPLIGVYGATQIFGPQKGVSEPLLKEVESSMESYAQALANHFQRDYRQAPSGGAAGGIPYALMHIYPTQVLSGIEFISELAGLENEIQQASLVITGEGKIDEQSFYGKTIDYVITLCKKHQKPFILICGINQLSDYKDPLCLGVFELISVAKDVSESMNKGSLVLERLIEHELKPIIEEYFNK